MIIYVTKQTFDRYKLRMPEDLTPPMNILAQNIMEKESGNTLMEWGGKLFYFDHRKCMQIVNFASKFTIFLVDVKINDLHDIGDYMAEYLFNIYAGDKKMKQALNHMFKEHAAACFSRLKDKSIISTLNMTQRSFASNGYRFYDFINNGILHTKEINYNVNFNWLFTMKQNKKTEYYYAGERFREIVVAKY